MKLLILLLLPLSVFANPVILTWTAPTEREDLTPLPQSEIAGYAIYCYQGSALVVNENIGNVTATTVDLPIGTSGCRLTTIDTDGLRSKPSNKAVIVVENSPPNPPVLQ